MKISWKYPSDLTDRQWRLIQRLLPARKRRGRPRVDRRRVLDAVLYVVRSGCQWRMLPRSFPNWNTVYGVFRQWRIAGVWQRIHDALRKQLRKAEDKKSSPTVAIVDSQSIRTAEGGEERGYDAGKKVTGRKRHLAVDTLGLVLAVVVHGGYWQDHDGACFVMYALQRAYRRLKVVFADGAYARNDLPAWVRQTFGWTLQTVLRPVGVKGFVALPKRWIVERTFAWICRYRRNAKDYERKPENSEVMIHIAMIALMSNRLAKRNN
jgi:putative transposase